MEESSSSPRPGMLPRRHKQGEIGSFRADHDTSRPEAKSRRRDDGSGQAAMRDVALRPRSPNWPTYPHRTPSGGGHAPTPDRSKYPAIGMTQKGIDQPRPVTEARM